MKLQDVKHRESAQVVVLFSIALVAMLAMVGVTVGGGMLYVQRRTAQNAADAAALAGARALQQATTASMPAIPYEICKYVVANNFDVTPTADAYFVDTTGTQITGGDIALPTNCAGTVSNTTILSGSSGVHVDVTFGPYNTTVVGVVGIRQLSAAGSAIFACMSVYPGSDGTNKWWGRLEYPNSCPTYPYKPTWTFGLPTNDTLIALTQ